MEAMQKFVWPHLRIVAAWEEGGWLMPLVYDPADLEGGALSRGLVVMLHIRNGAQFLA